MYCRVTIVGLVVALLIAGAAGPATAQPQYYNYNTSANANSFPFGIDTGKEVQLLYLPGDFNQPSPAPAGNITSISFRVADGYTLGPWQYTSFTIKLGQSTITSFTSGSFYAGSLTTVYSRTTVTLQANAGSWLTIPLDTPFPYDPTQSLIVDVGQCGAPNANGFPSAFTLMTDNRRIWSVGGCPFEYYGVGSHVYHLGLNVDAVEPVEPIPAATEWGLLALAALLGALALYWLRRQMT